MKKGINDGIGVKILWNMYGYYGGSFDGSCFDTNQLCPCLKVGGGVPRVFDIIGDINDEPDAEMENKWKPEEQKFTPQTSDGCSPAITAACARAGITNMLSMGHYPIPGVIEKGEYIPKD